LGRLGPLLRISFGLVVLTCTILISLDLLGFVPAPADTALNARVRLCETLATQTAPAAQRNDMASIRAAIETTVRRNDEVLSAGMRAADGRLLVASGDHQMLWNPQGEEGSTPSHVRLPLFKGGKPWATIEVRFHELGSEGWLAALWERPLLRLLGLFAALGFVTYLFYMRRTLRHLDPSAVIPTRVQAALDVMAEGVLLLDQQERIVLANAAFAERLGRSPTKLLGLKASALDWKRPDSSEANDPFPWMEAIRESRTSVGSVLQIEVGDDEKRIFVVNGSPVLDGWGRSKGAIVTFDDVTELERKSTALQEALVMLEKSQDEIRLRNEELQVLAKRDPLTGLANRRAFFEWLEHQFTAAKRGGQTLCCLMADIDHFKRINDTHGHSAGDEVIRRIAEAFTAEVRSGDSVCRYGGEEFCVVLPGAPIEAAAAAAERLRLKIQSPGFARVPVTVSFGVSSSRFGATKPTELINQADDALYASKEAGRNRVTRWDEMAR
jgi:diguanylate cyclase (GGDEF)-like protein/PAS domain S-box-containing protein